MDDQTPAWEAIGFLANEQAVVLRCRCCGSQIRVGLLEYQAGDWDGITFVDEELQRRLSMIPANVREAMERMKGDQWTGNDAVVVAKFAVPILERLVQTIEDRQRQTDDDWLLRDGMDEIYTLKTILGAT